MRRRDRVEHGTPTIIAEKMKHLRDDWCRRYPDHPHSLLCGRVSKERLLVLTSVPFISVLCVLKPYLEFWLILNMDTFL